MLFQIVSLKQKLLLQIVMRQPVETSCLQYDRDISNNQKRRWNCLVRGAARPCLTLQSTA